MSDSYWIARLRTAASRTSGNSGSGSSSSVRARNTPSRGPPRSLRSVKPAELEHRLQHDRRREDDVAPPRLDPRDIAALGRRQGGQHLDQRVQRRRRDHVALDADVDPADQPVGRALRPPKRGCVRRRRRRPAGHREAAANRRRASDLADVSEPALQVLVRAGSPGRCRQEALGEAQSAERVRGQRPARGGPPPPSSCMLPPPMSSTTPSRERGGVDRCDIAVARLLPG